MSKFPTNKKAHYDRVARLGCIITQGPATIHHVKGRSVGARLVSMGMDGTRGVGMRGYGDALVIPLCAELHYAGSKSIDGGMGTEKWESVHGRQDELVDQVSEWLGYDLWELHREWLAKARSSRRSGTTSKRSR